jgi:serine/threonine protein kinase
MHMGEKDIVGQGTCSVCRKGSCMATGKMVAVKVYRSGGRAHVSSIAIRRQVAVLRELQRALAPPPDKLMWDEQLARVKPSSLFVQLLDYSRDGESGDTGKDAHGDMYVITELGSCSLKDYLVARQTRHEALSKDAVCCITKAIVLATAALHAKGLVHLDIKPENLMFFDGCLKIIDVDGCLSIGAGVSIDRSDHTFFSLLYCAPEWASLLTGGVPELTVAPALDSWSVGMTLCELVLLDAALKPTFLGFLKRVPCRSRASFLFMEWLSSVKTIELPHQIGSFDAEFEDLLSNWLLVREASSRRRLVESLSHPFLAQASLGTLANDHFILPSAKSDLPQLHRGTLWKPSDDDDDGDESEQDRWMGT